MTNNKKPSEPVEEERWAERSSSMKSPSVLQVVALCIQILALVVILLKR